MSTRPLASPTFSAEGYRLSGPSVCLDPRTHAYRCDLADIALAASVLVPHYARPLDRSCIVGEVMIRAAPQAGARAVSQLAWGEAFALLDQADGWAWGYSLADHYVGYVPVTALGPWTDPSHVVDVPLALLFKEPDIKSPLVDRLPMGARLRMEGETGQFVRCAQGWVHHQHLRPLPAKGGDPVAIAERLVGAPYLWGGRTGSGLDCSGLVQLSLALTGRHAPRDSDQQRTALGRSIDTASLQRGDIVFFPGHVGFMVDESRLIHANAHWMQVRVEPLADVVARLSPIHEHPISEARRLD